MKSKKTLREWLSYRNVIDFPPLWTVGVMIVALVLSRCTVSLAIDFPKVFGFNSGVCLGVVLCVLAFGLMIWCAYTLVRARTPALPHNDAEALVTHGPYRWSRNPIYLADVILLISFTFMCQTWWPALLAPGLYLILRIRFVIPEESMLKERFPEAFARWSEGTRRWL